MRRARPLLVVGALLAAGCAELQPFDPPVADGLREGPGLFTGASGEFRLHRPAFGGPAESPPRAPAAEPDLTKPPAR